MRSFVQANELCEEILRALNKATGKCSQQCETSPNYLSSELFILKEENKASREKLQVVNKELKNMREEMVLLRKALAYDGSYLIHPNFNSFEGEGF
ncbi:hypothetical protein V6N13_014214 [Hibiscus sabdariffa]|uniref:Uncharacterized protein n=1 Tax=Hibiscus sabdariffa TaxID=183260 RepID=A0ABR2RUS9_9ROSI